MFVHSVRSSRFVLASAALLGLLCSTSVSSQAQVTVYTNNFNSGSTMGFTSPTGLTLGTRTDGAQTYLATPGSTYGFGAGTATLTVNNAALVGNVTVAFDLYINGSMDGNGQEGNGPDPWSLTANANTLINTNFANYTGANTQQFVSLANPNGGSAAPRTGSDAALAGQLGFGTGNFGDSTYHLRFTFANATPTVAFNFTSGLNEGSGNEGWGLDNVVVTSVATPTATPEPGSVAMLVGMTVTGAGFLARRRRK